MVLRKSPSPKDSGSTWQQRLVPDDPTAGWRDMLGPITLPGTDISDPVRASILGSGHKAFRFALGNYFEIAFHIQHDYRPGTPMYSHVHWCADGVDGNVVAWEWTWIYARGFGRGYFDCSDDSGQVVSASEAPLPPTGDNSDQLAHMTTEIEVPFFDTLFEPDGIILLKLQRVGNEGTDNQDGIFVFTSDIHYQANGICTTARQPPFVESD